MQRRLGRYFLREELASGGMATVHLGKLVADGGFSRVVAIKVLHANLARDEDFRTMFLDEARIVSRIRHANVVSTLDVLESLGELFLVMDYVHGPPVSSVLRHLLRAGEPVPLPIATAIVIDALEGLHAAHEARTEEGQPLRIVHRDVSPQNILIGADGVARVLDFGIAHAAHRLQRTMPGQIKGKAAYMAPEQARGDAIDRRVDVYAAAVLLWEIVTGSRLFQAETFSGLLMRQMYEEPPAPSSLRADVPPALDQIILRGLAKNADDRFATAREMARAIEASVPPAGSAEVAIWLARVEAPFFKERDALLERSNASGDDTRTDLAHAPTLVAPLPADLDTVLEGPSRGTPQQAGARSRVVVITALLAAALGALGVFAVARLRAAPAVHTDATSQPVPVPPQASAVPPPATSESPAEPQASASTSSSAVPTTVPHAPAAHRSPSTVSSVPSAPAAAPSSLPMCCVNQLQIRYHDCVDNCPK